MADVLARSPLAEHTFATLPDVAVAERPVGSLVQVAAFAGGEEAVNAALAALGLPALPPSRGSTAAGEAVLLDVGPRRALVLSPEPGLAGRLADAVPDEAGTVTDLGHARLCLRVEGPRAAWVLSKGVAIDLHPSAFPVGAVAVTVVEHVGVVLHRVTEDAFDLLPYRGFAVALVEWLEVAGRRDVP